MNRFERDLLRFKASPTLQGAESFIATHISPTCRTLAKMVPFKFANPDDAALLASIRCWKVVLSVNAPGQFSPAMFVRVIRVAFAQYEQAEKARLRAKLQKAEAEKRAAHLKTYS